MLKLNWCIDITKVEDCYGILGPNPRFTMFERVELLNEIVETYNIIPIVEVTKYIKDAAPSSERGKHHRDMVQRHLRSMNPNMIICAKANMLCIPELAKFAGVLYMDIIYIERGGDCRSPILIKPGAKFNFEDRGKSITKFGARLAHNLMFNYVWVDDCKALASLAPDRKINVVMTGGSELTDDITGMHIYKLRITLYRDCSDMIRLLGSIGILESPLLPQIPVDFVVKEIVFNHTMTQNCQYIADNPNIRTIVASRMFEADFTNNTTLLSYEGPDPKIKEIADRNTQDIINRRFARTKVAEH